MRGDANSDAHFSKVNQLKHQYCHSCSSSPTAEMVATQPSNKKKNPVQSELDESDVDDDDDDDDSDGGKCSHMRRSRSRKPGLMSRVTKQAKKAAATKAAVQLELEMAEMDAQQAKQASHPPTSKVLKKPQTVSSNQKSKSFRAKDISSPEQPLTKSQKVCKDVEAVKRCMLENRGDVLEGDETGDTDQDVGVVGEKRRKGKDRALSDNDGQSDNSNQR
ncbi:hypothetical protein F4604DRAFT_1687330 [Suillus subluteus]|nr:hypothetical protein F4604DRAFT_1687330 [Suillus subluteus]